MTTWKYYCYFRIYFNPFCKVDGQKVTALMSNVCRRTFFCYIETFGGCERNSFLLRKLLSFKFFWNINNRKTSCIILKLVFKIHKIKLRLSSNRVLVVLFWNSIKQERYKAFVVAIFPFIFITYFYQITSSFKNKLVPLKFKTSSMSSLLNKGKCG